MIRLGFLLALLVIGRAHAESFDRPRMIAVYAEALGFVAPRILEPVPVPELTFWGLQGLTETDPALRVVSQEHQLRLFRHDQLVLAEPMPSDDGPASWALAAANITQAAFGVSAELHRVGTQGVMGAFFDQMFSRLDPYSRYVAPAEAGEDRANRGGKAGVGITADQRGASIAVTEVIRDSPAAVAGVRAGDVLLAVDDQRTARQDPDTIAALLAGPEGSVVAITWRSKDGRIRDTELVRMMVPPETVFAQRTGDVLLLRITGFSATTAHHIAEAVQEAVAEPRPADGIILDIRDNRGGLLRQAVEAADIFLPDGLIATTIGRDPDARNVWRSTAGELAQNVPVIVLVDGRTASAAEILAAALADRGRAVVVGSVTTGKGMVQTIDPLPDGGELFVTWSQMLAPLGWPLQGLGVLPQVCTSLGLDALSRQLSALSAGMQPEAAAIRRERKARLPLAATTILELRAPCPASSGHSADVDAARLLIANPAAYASALLPPMAP